MTLRFVSIFFLIIGVRLGYSFGQPAVSSSIRYADSLYTAGAYQEASVNYQKILSQGITDPDLLFNMGAAATQTGDVASSIYYFERALRYDHHDKKIHEAIKLQRIKIENAVVPIEIFFLKNWALNFITFLRPAYWALIGLLMLMIALVRWWHQLGIIKSIFFLSRFPVLLYLGSGILMLSIALISYKVMCRINEGIVFSECDFREAPSTDSPLTRQLHAGEKVIIKDVLSDYYRVDLLNLDKGWIRKDCVRIIRAGELQ